MSELLIRFGDVFLYAEDNKRKYVIVDVCEKNYFFVSELVESEDRLGIAGTSCITDIGAIVGSLGLDEIIRMTENNIGTKSDTIRAELLTNSRKPSRVISGQF